MLQKLDGPLLLVDDDSQGAELMLRRLDAMEHSSLTVRCVASLAEAVEAVHDLRPFVVLADLSLADAEGMQMVRVLTEVCPDDCPVIVLGDERSQEVALAALELGAQDYLPKDGIDAALLERSIRFACARSRIRAPRSTVAPESDRPALLAAEFANVMAHDLRAPLRTARLFADRLLARLDGGDKIAIDFGSRLEQSLHRADAVIVAALGGDSPRAGS